MESRTASRGFFDGVTKHMVSVDQNHGGGFQMYRLDTQDCRPIIEHNNELMLRGGSRTGLFGKIELCIPELELYNLKRRFPDLASHDRDIRVKAWRKYIRLAESRPWRVSKSKRYV